MRRIVKIALLAGLASACGRTADPGNPSLNPATGGKASSSGTGSGGNGSTSKAGSGPTGGGATAGEAGVDDGGAESGGSAGNGDESMAGASGSGGGSSIDITQVVPSDGCGTAYPGNTGDVVNTIQTMGTKEPDCTARHNGQSKCGPWSTPRDYYVYLPEDYDLNAPYPLVFEGPGCTGNGTHVYPLTDPYPDGAANAGNTVIRVGLTPGPVELGHGTNDNQGCFDDKEGDDSIDWVFYEALYDKLSEELCFDRNRVFAAGNSSGAWLANELGCKYAGDPTRPVRGVLPNTGGLPIEPQFVPTCTSAPMAGMWVHEVDDSTGASSAGNKVAIRRAMSVNSCTIGNNVDNAMFEDFPIGSGQPSTVCKRIMGCDPLYPLVVCPLPGAGHGNHNEVANPGFSTFIKAFSQPPLLSP